MTMTKNRERCGDLGTGTPGKRLKSAWKVSGSKTSLKYFVRGIAKRSPKDVTEYVQEEKDAVKWLG
jgi:hypothetical protein